jgi:hypothetical protein
VACRSASIGSSIYGITYAMHLIFFGIYHMVRN